MLAFSNLAAVHGEFCKLKVLALHGYAQTGAVLRDRSGGFRKPLRKSLFDVSFPDAPFGCTASGEDEREADADTSRRAWWRGHSGLETYIGWPESRQALLSLWDREGGFDGVLGFSQGAGAAAMICAEMRPRFGIFVSGFVPRDEEAARALLAGVDGAVHSLHILGLQDELVVAERSRALSDCFASATIVEHQGGHYIPSNAAMRAELAGFLDKKVFPTQQ